MYPESGRTDRRARALGVVQRSLTFRRDGEGLKSERFQRGLSILRSEGFDDRFNWLQGRERTYSINIVAT
jgi:hypothetical protein